MNQIEIYVKGNNDYKHNGDITLQPLECTYEVEINSSHELTLLHDLDSIGRWKYISEDNVIAIYNDKIGKKEFYRIYCTEKDLFEITAYARPVGYDLVDYVLIDTRPTEKNGQDALNDILANTPFKGHSNISDISTAYYVRKNCLEAITSDDENSFFNRWGGEIYFDNWDIYVNDKIGSDKGLRVELGYNLESIEEKINIDEVVTRVIPVGADGIMLDGDKPWIDSKNINKYTHIKTRVIEFSDVKVSEENSDEGFATLSEAQAELKRLVNKAYDNGLDKPTVTYTIDMISLRDSVNYDDYKILEDVNEGDTVHVKVKKLDIDVETRVNKINIDKLTGRINSLVLGTVEKNFFKEQVDIQNKVNNIINKNGTVKANSIEGTINALNTKFKALREIAEQQHVRAMLFEDDVQGSKTYGAMCIGSMGFEIASEKVNGEWQWRTFGTGQGFTADLIIAGTLSAIIIQNVSKTFKIDLSGNNGAQFYNNSLLAMAMSGNSIKFYNWGKEGDYIGSIGSTNTIDSSHPNGNPNKPNIAVWNDLDSSFAIQYATKSGINSNYIKFDKYKVQDNTGVPITICEDTQINKQLHMENYLKMHNWKIFLSDNMKAFLWCTTVNNSVMAVYANELYVPGTVWAGNTGTAGADYAEMFEWLDGNTENEDRIGYLVSLEGDKIVKANGTDVLGIISGTASVLGDLAPEWQNKYLKDKWGRYLLDDEGNKIISPDYDESKEYLDRSSRKEWGTVGLVGKIICRSDGSLNVGDYVQAINGIATKSTEKTNIKVINIIDDETVKVFIR